MNIDEVMSEVAALLETIPKLRVADHPVSSVNPPHAIVSLPAISFDLTYGRGSDRLSLPVLLAVGLVHDKAARANIAPFIAGAGAKSFKAVLEAPDEYESFDTLQVQSVEFDVITWGAIEYLAATFTLDITGDGA